MIKHTVKQNTIKSHFELLILQFECFCSIQIKEKLEFVFDNCKVANCSSNIIKQRKPRFDGLRRPGLQVTESKRLASQLARLITRKKAHPLQQKSSAKYLSIQNCIMIEISVCYICLAVWSLDEETSKRTNRAVDLRFFWMHVIYYSYSLTSYVELLFFMGIFIYLGDV